MSRKIQSSEYVTDEQQNRFITYYIIKQLWLKQKKSVDELYITLFPTKRDGGNKTLYDEILRLEPVDLEKRVDIPSLYQKTGLSAQYWKGNKPLELQDIIETDWKQLISLRRNRGSGSKSSTQKSLENKIKEKISFAYCNESKCSYALQLIIHYIITGEKREDDTCVNRIYNVMSLISEFDRRELETADPELIEKYDKGLSEHYACIKAINILNKGFKK